MADGPTPTASSQPSIRAVPETYWRGDLDAESAGARSEESAIKFQSVRASAFKSTNPAFQLSSGERRQPIRSRICFRGRVHPRPRASALPRLKREFIAHALGGAAEHVGSRWDALRFFFFFVGEGTDGTLG